MSLRTPLCDLLGISVPVISAPFSAAPPALVAAVSNAGGLGLYGGTWVDPAGIAAAVAEIRSLTDRPFGLNLVLEWDMRDRVLAALDAGVRIFSFTWGDSAALAELVHEAGGTVLHTVAGVEEARQVSRSGADVVVAQAWEAGGHVRTEIAAMPMVPAVCDAVAPLPVVLAGGVSDGRGLAAALALGASGVWLGTRFLTATEARVHPEYRKAVIGSSATDTVLTTLFDGGWDGQHRVLRNSTVQEWEAQGRPPTGARPGEHDVVGHSPAGGGRDIPRYDMTSPSAGTTGDVEAMALYAGQSVELVQDSKPAAAIVASLVSEAEAALQRADALRRPRAE
jgi:nitronate monooxygenase